MSQPLAGRHAVAVGLGLPLGAGVFYLPTGVQNLGGPGTPVAYLAATLAVCSLAVAYAVFLSSPLSARDGVVYLAVSRTWGSRTAGFLAVWPAVGGYVAALAVLVETLGRAVAGPLGVDPTPVALLALLGVVLVHARGPAVAGRLQLLVTGTLCLALAVGIAVGLTGVVPDNFVPLFPTPTLSDRPVYSLGVAAVTAVVGFVGVDAGAAASAVTRAPRRTAPRALVVATLLAGSVATLGAVVTLGVIPWSRLVFATTPFADAVAAMLDVPTGVLLGPGVPLATASAALAVTWLPARTLRGLAELVPALDRRTPAGVPDPALAVTGLLAAALVAADAVGYGLYLLVPGATLQYACLAASAAALPALRPALARRCRFVPPTPALVGVALVGTLTAAVVLGRTLLFDPWTVVGVTRVAPAAGALDASVLVRDPLSTVLPALLGWELLGVALLAVAADYRADRGVDLPPLAAAYGRDDGSE